MEKDLTELIFDDLPLPKHPEKKKECVRCGRVYIFGACSCFDDIEDQLNRITEWQEEY